MLPVQLEMALAAVGWGTRDLAKAASVSLDTIGRFKRGEVVRERTIAAMRTALEGAGVEFIPEGPYQGDGGAGARLRQEQ